ncbi:hypothetical protein WR25_16189 [Diploscapter pachys]|uniref:Uncharacterized protein n=1 Tax=Diploscapter pachys TaxID=2018661 RepID=A0A2A2KTV3_9BILA|nr:hypothetical protein WR25_16189 [Diploscapter pachys]
MCSMNLRIEHCQKLQDSEAASSSASSSDDEDILPGLSRPSTTKLYFNNQSPMVAGDGNLVRHSLMSLVAEDDIPLLLEAMNEQFACTFVDLNNQKPSTSSIIHDEEKRKERRKQRQVSRIRFEQTAPEVYTYLDEISAINSQQWVEGTLLDYQGYQKLLAAEQEEYEARLNELEKWKASLTKPAENAVDNSVKPTYNRWGSIDRNETNRLKLIEERPNGLISIGFDSGRLTVH